MAKLTTEQRTSRIYNKHSREVQAKAAQLTQRLRMARRQANGLAALELQPRLLWRLYIEDLLYWVGPMPIEFALAT